MNRNLHCLGELASCAQICMECAQVCGETIKTCLARRDSPVDQELLECLIDCMTICQASASLLTRASPNHMITCRAVAEITGRCAEICERADDPALEHCANECTGTAASCRAMIGEG